MKAGIYLRQSLDVAEGIVNQRERCTALLRARGWELTSEYVDNDTSASKKRGPGTSWAKMLADATSGQFDVIVAVDVDRLLRSVGDLVDLTETGAKVLTVDGEIDLTTADGEFRATMLAGIARFEVRRKSERQTRANEARARKGVRGGGRRPFGYEAGGVAVREDEAQAIRDGYRMMLAGDNMSTVARMWNDRGFTTDQTRPDAETPAFNRGNVREILSNQRNVGRMVYLGEVQATPAEWPPIIDEATFEGVRAIIDGHARKNTGRNPTALLSGHAECGVCRSTVHSSGRARTGHRGYRCSGALGHISRKAEPIEDFVVAVVLERLSRPDARNLLSKPVTVDTGALHSEAVALRERLESVAVQYADGILTATQLRAATERIRGRLVEVEAELADGARVDVLGALAGADDVQAVWDGLPPTRRAAVVRELMLVTIHPVGRGVRTFRPESVSIEWRS